MSEMNSTTESVAKSTDWSGSMALTETQLIAVSKTIGFLLENGSGAAQAQAIELHRAFDLAEFVVTREGDGAPIWFPSGRVATACEFGEICELHGGSQ